MDKFRITGGRPLAGRVKVSGAKNAALPALTAALLTEERVILHNVPRVRDISTLRSLLEDLGVDSSVTDEAHGNRIEIEARQLLNPVAPYELVKQMRASILVLGPLVARFGQARVSLPGGCAIGVRPVNLHLKGLEKLVRHDHFRSRLRRCPSEWIARHRVLFRHRFRDRHGEFDDGGGACRGCDRAGKRCPRA